MKTNSILTIVIFALALLFGWQCSPKESSFDFGITLSDKHRGVNWVGGQKELEGWELDSLSYYGITHIAQSPYGLQENPNFFDFRWEINLSKTWWGESTEGLKTTTDLAKNLSITSILKPHIYLGENNPGQIEMKSEADWKIWFGMYEDFILHYAKIAEEKEIPLLCIGTELDGTVHRLKEWRELIANIRAVYSGKLVYASNFDQFEKVKFWDDLDYIGIQAFFPLSKTTNPELEEMIKSWEKIHPKIEKIVSKFNKPVIFTEIGYCNTDDAAIEPWLWPSQRISSGISNEVQARCYEAFFQSTWEKDWLAGAYFWKWYPKKPDFELDFTPQRKEAAEVLRTYFQGN